MKNKNSQNNLSVRKIITFLIIIIFIVAGVIIVTGGGNGQNNRNAKASQLLAAESSYDFGSISMAKGKVKKVFTAKNNSSQTIKAKKLYTSCMCTQATLFASDKSFGPFGMPAHGFIPEINKDLKPGEEIKIEVVFDPAAHGPAGVGPIERQAILETDDGQLILSFKANVTP